MMKTLSHERFSDMRHVIKRLSGRTEEPSVRRWDRCVGIILLSLLMFPVLPIFAQTPLKLSPTPVVMTPEEEASRKTLTTLKGILTAQNAVLTKIEQQEEALKVADTEDAKTKIREELTELQERLTAMENNFQSIATGIDISSFEQKPSTAFDWQEEIREIVGPIIEELKNMTARPREIERLRSEINTYTKQRLLINNALDHLLILKQYATIPEVEQHLTSLENAWIEREKEISNHLEVAQYQLAEKQNAEKPLTDSMQELMRDFFSSRGRNVLLAILAFIGVFLLLQHLYKYFVKISPFHGGRKRTFYGRLIDVLYMVGTFIGSIMAVIVVLYVAADWVLLGLVIILLLGIVWAARQGGAMMWEQGKLLLNLGTVRENERVIYNNLPWKVLSLNLHTRFHNPALKGGMIRLPLRDLIGLQSRPFYKDEPWFPCQEDDWVLLGDGTFGRVIMQTPEIVQLHLLGGSDKTYPTTAFLDQTPTNLSQNFRVDVTFGIDYKHQSLSTQDVPVKLKARIQSDLEKEGYKNHLGNLAVEFKTAGASSLDMAILADFSGEVASDYPKLERLLHRIAVDACNEHGWEIPFTQVTVHTAQA